MQRKTIQCSVARWRAFIINIVQCWFVLIGADVITGQVLQQLLSYHQQKNNLSLLRTYTVTRSGIACAAWQTASSSFTSLTPYHRGIISIVTKTNCFIFWNIWWGNEVLLVFIMLYYSIISILIYSSAKSKDQIKKLV